MGGGDKMRGFAILLAPALWAQGVITTIAGTDVLFPPDAPLAVEAPLGLPAGLGFDARGDLVVADADAALVLRLRGDRAGVIAGTGIPAFGVNIGENIPAERATLAGLRDLATDAAGNVYVLAAGTVRRISPDGLVRTVLGEGVVAGSLSSVLKIAVDPAGSSVYLIEPFQHRIRRLSGGAISTVCGNGDGGFSGDGGPAINAQLQSPAGAAVDAQGNLYIADSGNRRLRIIDRAGIIRTVAGPANIDAGELISVAVEPSGEVLYGGRWLRRLVPGANSSTSLIDDRPIGFSGDGGPAAAAAVTVIAGIAVNRAGEVFLSDSANRRVRRIGRDSRIATVLGSGTYRFQGDGGPATAALLSNPGKLAADTAGNVYLADVGNRRYRRVSATGAISTVAGIGSSNLAPDSPPSAVAPFTQVRSIAVDERGVVYMTDQRTFRVRRMGADGRVVPFAGNGAPGNAGDGGPAVAAALRDPSSVAVGLDGSVFIGDGNRVRRVDPSGTIRAFAGTGTVGASGDGGQAAAAQLEDVFDLAVDRAGTVYISTTGPVANGRQSRIRAVAPSGAIRTLPILLEAGGVAIAAAGDSLLFTAGCSVRRINTAGVVTVVAGFVAQCSSEGDGVVSTSAALAIPAGIAADAAGNIFISEGGGDRVRQILARPPAAAAAPRSLTFAAGSRGAPPPTQTIAISCSIPNVPFTVTIDDGGRRWLSADDLRGVSPRSLEIGADPELLSPGVYEGTIRLDFPNASPTSISVAVRFEVGPALPPLLQTDQPSITFTYPRQASTRTEALVVSNAGSGPLPFSVRVRSNGDWLRARPAQGAARPSDPVQINVAADSTGLAPGTYGGTVGIFADRQSKEIPVTLLVSDRDQAIRLSQSGLSFTAVQTGGSPPPQEFGVINLGTGEMSFQISASTLTGGDWLRVSARDGSAVAGTPAPVYRVSVAHVDLPPGRYYGQVRIDSDSAANSPHVLTVNLEVLPPGENPGAALQPHALRFEASEGGVPGAKEFFVYNLTPRPVSYRSLGVHVELLPRDAVVEPNQPLRVLVQPAPNPAVAGRKPGIFMQFSDGILRQLPVEFTTDPFLSASAKPGERAAAGCAAKTLAPTLVSLGQSQTAPAGWPAGIAVEVKDDCGTPMDTGSVTVSFSNGDPPVALQPLKDGRWHGTWQSRNASNPKITVRIEAEQPDPKLRGLREVQADLRASQDPPSLAPEGVVSAAAPAPFSPLAAGGLIAINGERLTGSLSEASTAPWPVQLAGSEVVVAGRRIPLSAASADRIAAILPGDLAVNTTHQILVRRGTAYTRPVPINVAAAQPAIYPFLSAARVGEPLLIVCAGLGATDPVVPAGEAAPEGARTTAPLKVTIGGAEASVVSAILAPSLVGVYHVTVTVPSGVSGDAVPVVVEAAGQSSAPAMVAVR